MFLDVSVTLGDVDMTDAERKRIGQTVGIRRRAKFGTKSAAYRQAGLNAATWDRIEAGEPVREDRMAAALQLLWPESGGDWRSAIEEMDARMAKLVKMRSPMFGGSWEDPDYLGSIEEWIEELQGRIEVIEAAVFEGENDEQQRDTASKTRAPGSGAHDVSTTRVERDTDREVRVPREENARPRGD